MDEEHNKFDVWWKEYRARHNRKALWVLGMAFLLPLSIVTNFPVRFLSEFPLLYTPFATVSSILLLLFFILLPVGLILSLVALVRILRKKEHGIPVLLVSWVIYALPVPLLLLNADVQMVVAPILYKNNPSVERCCYVESARLTAALTNQVEVMVTLWAGYKPASQMSEDEVAQQHERIVQQQETILNALQCVGEVQYSRMSEDEPKMFMVMDQDAFDVLRQAPKGVVQSISQTRGVHEWTDAERVPVMNMEDKEKVCETLISEAPWARNVQEDKGVCISCLFDEVKRLAHLVFGSDDVEQSQATKDAIKKLEVIKKRHYTFPSANSSCDYALPPGLQPRSVGTKGDVEMGWAARLYDVRYETDYIKVKFVEGSDVRLRDGKLISLCNEDLSVLYEVLATYPEITIVGPAGDEEQNEARKKEYEEQTGYESADSNLYYTLYLPGNTDEELIVVFRNAINALPIIEAAWITEKQKGSGDVTPPPTMRIQPI